LASQALRLSVAFVDRLHPLEPELHTSGTRPSGRPAKCALLR
jgi:hypothetical protein